MIIFLLYLFKMTDMELKTGSVIFYSDRKKNSLFDEVAAEYLGANARWDAYKYCGIVVFVKGKYYLWTKIGSEIKLKKINNRFFKKYKCVIFYPYPELSDDEKQSLNFYLKKYKIKDPVALLPQIVINIYLKLRYFNMYYMYIYFYKHVFDILKEFDRYKDMKFKDSISDYLLLFDTNKFNVYIYG